MGYQRLRRGTKRRLRTSERQASSKVEGLPRQALGQLDAPLSSELVNERETRDGRVVQYLEGWAAISQANRIFGFDAWSAEVVGDVAFRPLRLMDADSGEQLAVGMYTATVRVSVKGCPAKTDVGCAFADLDTPEAHEIAYKGAVTDAMKRTLRQFGDQFANRLYVRREHAESSPVPTAGPVSSAKLQEMRRRVIDLSARLGVNEEKAREWVQKRCDSALDDLSAEQLSDAVRFLANELNQRNGPAAERRNGKAAAA